MEKHIRLIEDSKVNNYLTCSENNLNLNNFHNSNHKNNRKLFENWLNFFNNKVWNILNPYIYIKNIQKREEIKIEINQTFYQIYENIESEIKLLKHKFDDISSNIIAYKKYKLIFVNNIWNLFIELKKNKEIVYFIKLESKQDAEIFEDKIINPLRKEIEESLKS